jgi:hypothetical protein
MMNVLSNINKKSDREVERHPKEYEVEDIRPDVMPTEQSVDK